ncbi:MAG: hypothetical protein WBW26_14235, partial [Bradyrhizobium sp.]|uniref:hypothetical protein n=1 Tax=Bradyrhizobium sp. TaxID=376 RepID=UPI003C4F0D6F
GLTSFSRGLLDADTMLAAGGKYNGDNTQIERGLSHDHTLRPRPLDHDLTTADTTVAAGNG